MSDSLREDGWTDAHALEEYALGQRRDGSPHVSQAQLVARVTAEVLDALGLPAVEPDRDALDLVLRIASGPKRIPGRDLHSVVAAAVARALEREADNGV